MTQDEFQKYVLIKLAEIKNLFIKNEQDHGELNTKIGSVRTEVESVRTEVESVRTEVESVKVQVESVKGELTERIENAKTEIHKTFNSHLRWSIGISISLVGLAFIIAKYVT